MDLEAGSLTIYQYDKLSEFGTEWLRLQRARTHNKQNNDAENVRGEYSLPEGVLTDNASAHPPSADSSVATFANR